MKQKVRMYDKDFFFFVCENNTSHFGSHLVEDHNGKRLGRKVRIIYNYKFWLPKITRLIINKKKKKKYSFAVTRSRKFIVSQVHNIQTC